MATMAKWGSKSWVVSSSKVVALEGLSFSYEQVADNNGSTQEKKTTNQRGTELFPLSFSTTLHAGAGVDIRAEIAEWEKLVTKVNYFYLNGKLLHSKQLQLRKVAVSDVRLDDLGRMRLATLSFEFKEYDASTTSVKISTNTAAKKATTKTIKVGDYVKPTGKKYATGQTIPDWVKKQKHKVSQIKSDRLLLGHPSGINSWVYKNEVTLV